MLPDAHVLRQAWRQNEDTEAVSKEFLEALENQETANILHGAYDGISEAEEGHPPPPMTVKLAFWAFFSLGRVVGKAEAEIEMLKGMDAT